MSLPRQRESGQTVVEFAIICLVMFVLLIGLLDVGRAFYIYNAVSAGARYGARWAAVVGGTCTERPPDVSTSDWCNQYNTATLASGASGSLNFWTAAGSYPPEPTTVSYTGEGTNKCPMTASDYDTAVTQHPSYFYQASAYAGSGGTSIAGAVTQHFTTSSGGYFKQLVGGYMPGIDLSLLRICIEEPTATSSGSTIWVQGPGEPVKVVLYYTFTPASGLLAKASFDMIASATYITQ